MIKSIIDYALIGKRIKERRSDLKLTQERLAQELNISTFYLSKIENGKATPTLETLAFIACRLQLDLSFLLTGTSTLEENYYIKELNAICSKATKEQLHLIAKIAKVIIEK